MMRFKDAYYLPSGRVFLLESEDGYPIECTEMRDVSVGGKDHFEVRNTLNPHVVWRHLVPYEDKWLLTVSTQKGCVHKCSFCDVPKLPFKGNLNYREILEQVDALLKYTPYVFESNKAKIGFARMGEPAHNLENVLLAMDHLHGEWPQFNWLPCFNSILPRKVLGGDSGKEVIPQVMNFKENYLNGRLHFQISCNSTDEDMRQKLFGGADVISLPEIVEEVNSWSVTDRTVTLNFIVMKGVPVDVDKLVKMGLSGDKFCVKLIPLNETDRGQESGLETYANYQNYEDLFELGREFEDKGIPTVIDAIAKCEEAGLCCGQLAHIHCK